MRPYLLRLTVTITRKDETIEVYTSSGLIDEYGETIVPIPRPIYIGKEDSIVMVGKLSHDEPPLPKGD